MKRQLSDNDIDQLVQRLVNDAALDDSTVSEIADSPQLWWGVQRMIKANEASPSNWPADFLRRWLMLGAPLTVAALLFAAFFVTQPTNEPVEQLLAEHDLSNRAVISKTEPDEVKVSDDKLPVGLGKKTESQLAHFRKSMHKTKNTKLQRLTRTDPHPEQTVVKSEFIALSYAQDSDSGQLVRVKVPSSMMVSLGLVSSVKEPSNLVDAEVLVGDDGLTRAIRFIKQ
jgi:hypothetical protein